MEGFMKEIKAALDTYTFPYLDQKAYIEWRSFYGAAALAVALAVLPPARAQPSYQPGLGFASVEVATGQSARVTARNLGRSSSTPDSSCGVTLQFLDSQ